MGGSGRGAAPSCIECEHARPRSCRFLNVQGDLTYPHGVTSHRVLQTSLKLSPFPNSGVFGGALGLRWWLYG